MVGDSPIDVLDIGAGDGWLAGRLLEHVPVGSRVVCWDTNYTDDDLASMPRAGLTFTVHRPRRRFDLVLMLDVLEHLEDDRGFLEAEVMPRLTADGLLVVSVPLHPILFAEHDRFLKHVRRYRTCEIRDRLAEVVEIEREGRLFASLLPARAIGKLIDVVHRSRMTRGVGDWGGSPLVTRIATTVLSADAHFGRFSARHGLPTPGLSYWAVGRAPVR